MLPFLRLGTHGFFAASSPLTINSRTSVAAAPTRSPVTSRRFWNLRSSSQKTRRVAGVCRVHSGARRRTGRELSRDCSVRHFSCPHQRLRPIPELARCCERYRERPRADVAIHAAGLDGQPDWISGCDVGGRMAVSTGDSTPPWPDPINVTMDGIPHVADRYILGQRAVSDRRAILSKTQRGNARRVTANDFATHASAIGDRAGGGGNHSRNC